MSDPLKPTTSLLMKIGSAVVHAEEAIGPTGTMTDFAAFNAVLSDPEVKEWLAAMNKMALLPVKR